MRTIEEFKLFNNEQLRKEKHIKEQMKDTKMKRSYKNNDSNENTNYFIGTEVENTRTKGLKTLFVVGLQEVNQILSIANMNNCQAIYFGANHSFAIKKNSDKEWLPWEKMIKEVLNTSKFWCLFDFDVKYQLSFLDTGLAENIKMIPVVSVKIPYIEQLGYNAVIKIDDMDFNKSNPGVWTHSVQDITYPDSFTHWDDYRNDEEW